MPKPNTITSMIDLNAKKSLEETDKQEQVEEYLFTDRERAFFMRQLGELSTMTAAVTNATNLICTQQGFEGRWQLKPDGSGLTKSRTDAA